MSEALFNMAFAGLTSDIDKKYAELAELRVRLDALLVDCPCTNLVRRENYTSGGYDHKSKTETWDECVCCEKKYNVQISYGSFQ